MEDKIEVIIRKIEILFKQKDQMIQKLQNCLDKAEREITRLISEQIGQKS